MPVTGTAGRSRAGGAAAGARRWQARTQCARGRDRAAIQRPAALPPAICARVLSGLVNLLADRASSPGRIDLASGRVLYPRSPAVKVFLSCDPPQPTAVRTRYPPSMRYRRSTSFGTTFGRLWASECQTWIGSAHWLLYKSARRVADRQDHNRRRSTPIIPERGDGVDAVRTCCRGRRVTGLAPRHTGSLSRTGSAAARSRILLDGNTSGDGVRSLRSNRARRTLAPRIGPSGHPNTNDSTRCWTKAFRSSVPIDPSVSERGPTHRGNTLHHRLDRRDAARTAF